MFVNKSQSIAWIAQGDIFAPLQRGIDKGNAMRLFIMGGIE